MFNIMIIEKVHTRLLQNLSDNTKLLFVDDINRMFM